MNTVFSFVIEHPFFSFVIIWLTCGMISACYRFVWDSYTRFLVRKYLFPTLDLLGEFLSLIFLGPITLWVAIRFDLWSYLKEKLSTKK